MLKRFISARYPAESFMRLIRKYVFPYEHFNIILRLDEQQLYLRSVFYSALSGKQCYEDEYAKRKAFGVSSDVARCVSTCSSTLR